MPGRLDFTTLDVFTDTPYLGNPLAVVHIPPNKTVSPSQKQKIAREFNYSECVFVHDHSLASAISDPNTPVTINIYTPYEELPFAGHPTIGTSVYLLANADRVGSNTESEPISTESTERHLTLLVPAGSIAVTYSPQTQLAQLSVPHAVSIHRPTSPLTTSLVAPYIGLDPSNTSSFFSSSSPEGSAGGETLASVSVVKGLTFVLSRLSSLQALEQTSRANQTLKSEDIGAGEGGFVAFYVYHILDEDESAGGKVVKIRTRLFEKDLGEDPATGSAASCLAAYLSLTTYSQELVKYEITQGIEMGRKSDITVQVKTKQGTDGSKAIDTIWLSGKAVEVMSGTVVIPEE